MELLAPFFLVQITHPLGCSTGLFSRKIASTPDEHAGHRHVLKTAS
jgi:hypothetical protein